MSRAFTAALLSALVFPGAGQLFLKRTARALLFLVPAGLAVLYFVSTLTVIANKLADDIVSGKMALDPVRIAAQLEQQGSLSTPLTNLSAGVMIACWGAAIIDAWLLGRKLGPAPATPDSLKGRP